ncbi:MAG: hypothetical protein KDJ26_01055 [Alphaproteobacteria bacterium]|nr:hypothetical protein [Alphaproteobacteria bacterium]MCB1550566.1 hypothetical protein [Alphaproteobacteria bacterium]MCB9984226.1 hypothetical protein [Micavibrio sp.]HPQ51185.1 hypothetical protein [Alphaproteobacteria bacterium]HRK97070.1 hypothetical protein [Alphaproteobacteria bacterium]
MSEKTIDQQFEWVIRIIRISAAVVFIAGLAVFLDLGGVATIFDLAEDSINKILGGVMMVLAVVDVVLIPRFLQASRKER